MSSLEGETRKTAAACIECGELYTVHVTPDGSVTPLGVTECTACGEDDFRPVGTAE